MASEWEEIRRLAADFQRAQFADTALRLSERDCIEIIARLVQDKKVEVVHTIDGKEYVTPAQISREIREELDRHGGRVNILELQQMINVNWVDVESRASDIAKSDRSVQLVLGQLVDDTYLNRVAEEVNDRLQEAGLIGISELCKSYDLPGDFLHDELAKRIGKVIQGELDQYSRGVIFTPAYVARHTAKIRGLFSAITRPTPVSGLLGAFGLQEHLLNGVLEELLTSGRLRGSVVGGRQDNAVYIPEIYSKTQNHWVDAFLQQNGYLEFDSLTRLGIPEPVGHIKKRFKDRKLLFLGAACVSQALVEQAEAEAEEAVNSATWSDMRGVLPSCLSDEDAAAAIEQAMRNADVQTAAVLLAGTVVVSQKWIGECLALFDRSVQERAQKEFKRNPVLLITEEDVKRAAVAENASGACKKDKREVERKGKGAAAEPAKAGGGGNAREIRTRKTKKKGKREEDEEESPAPPKKQEEAPFMTPEQIQAALEERLSGGGGGDFPQEILPELAEQLVRPLSKRYQEALRQLAASSACPLAPGANRKSVKDLQEELTNLYNNIRLFDKGAKLFSDETQALVAKHVLRSVGSRAANILVNFLAADLMMSVEEPAAMSAELRAKILSKVSDETKAPLMKLHNSLSAKSTADFLDNLESSAEACGFLLKKADKKKERAAFLLHRRTLAEQLKEARDPALVLHLTGALLFQDSTHCILHAPGRCVPQIVQVLAGRIPPEKHALLTLYQSLVVKQLTGRSQGRARDDPDRAPLEGDDQARLEDLTPQVKELVLSNNE
ncbi:E3 UFM1-protein ligase 1 [Syngnathus acus]|uniref:E3 UFM1-protein ligase 1 n=1 Tax=Syngnathus acus TaxID=161584 RepID=UPI001885CF1A|nr:E3 UFM1-protein ligase 1 [Syngnathus acus]